MRTQAGDGVGIADGCTKLQHGEMHKLRHPNLALIVYDDCQICLEGSSDKITAPCDCSEFE